MSDTPREIETLIDMMARLPGLGPRSARRAVLHLVKKRDPLMRPLSQAMQAVAENARDCGTCGNIATTPICGICANPDRATGTLCVVEDLILAAVKEAQARAAERSQEEMRKLTESMGLPADMKLPF